MTQLGFFAAVGAWATALLALLLGAGAYLRKRDDLLAAARNAVVACAFFTAVAAAGIIYAFVAGDFQLQYVWSHSDRDMPLLYKIGALWGGMQGSLLFWALLLSIFSTAVVLRHRHDKV